MKTIIIPVIAGILILGILGTAPDAFAPKKLFVGGLSWNAESQSFEVEVIVHHGMAKAVERADFTVETQLTAFSGGDVVFDKKETSSGQRQVDEFGRIKVHFPWDRSLPDGSIFEGPVYVTVESIILNPAGKPTSGSGHSAGTIIVDDDE